MHTVYSTHIVHKFSKVNHALDMAIEAHLPYVLVRSGPNPRSLLLGGGHSFPIKWIDPRSDPWGRWLRIHQQECRIHQQECIDFIESAYHDAWFCFTSIQVNVDMQAAPHIDSNNEGPNCFADAGSSNLSLLRARWHLVWTKWVGAGRRERLASVWLPSRVLAALGKLVYHMTRWHCSWRWPTIDVRNAQTRAVLRLRPRANGLAPKMVMDGVVLLFERTNERTNGRTNERRNEGTNERTNERTNDGTNEWTNERTNERRTNERWTESDFEWQSLRSLQGGLLQRHPFVWVTMLQWHVTMNAMRHRWVPFDGRKLHFTTPFTLHFTTAFESCNLSFDIWRC